MCNNKFNTSLFLAINLYFLVYIIIFSRILVDLITFESFRRLTLGIIVSVTITRNPENQMGEELE